MANEIDRSGQQLEPGSELLAKPVSRREFLKVAGLGLAAAGGLGGLLAACGGGETTPPANTTSASENPNTTSTTEAPSSTTTAVKQEKAPAQTNPEGWKPTNFLEKPNPSEALKTSFEHGKYQTFPRLVDANDINTEAKILQDIDLGTLGPDVDTVAGIDFPGFIKSGAAVAFWPENGQPIETRVVFIKRTDLETVQIRAAIGGDRFDIYQASKDGGDHALDVTARMHAFNTARKHQVVYYLGDLGLFEKQWGANEQELLQRIIRAQRPSRANIPDPDFVNERVFVPSK